MNSTGGKLVALGLGTVAVVVFLVYMAKFAIAPAAAAAPAPSAGLTLPDVLFYVLAGVTVFGAAGVALSRNILYSSIGLLAALLGAGALYVLLSADFVAIAQLLVYVGGVMVLVLFAVMLTNKITEVNVSNRSFGLFGGLLLLIAVAPVLAAVALLAPWRTQDVPGLERTTAAIGDALLTRWLLPFEVASLVLLATLVGAVVIARKELKAD